MGKNSPYVLLVKWLVKELQRLRFFNMEIFLLGSKIFKIISLSNQNDLTLPETIFELLISLRGYRSRHFLECRRLRNVKILPLHPTSPRGHQKMRQDLPHLSVPFTKREIETKYFILSPLSAAFSSFSIFFSAVT